MHCGSNCSLLVNLIIESKNSFTHTMSIHILYDIVVNSFVHMYICTYAGTCSSSRAKAYCGCTAFSQE